MDISKRLQGVAALVSYPVVADIGTDHGYVPIYLHKIGKLKKPRRIYFSIKPKE